MNASVAVRAGHESGSHRVAEHGPCVSPRDIVVQALAPATDPDNARGVLSDALNQLQVEAHLLAWAVNTADKGGKAMVEQAAYGIAARAAALQKFVDEYFEIDFRQSRFDRP